jgi:SulP family sulfate permease
MSLADWRLYVPKTYTVLRKGYGFGDFRADAIAGLTVAIVALPLSMALAIASGATPDRGLITAVVAGFVISLLGGSRFQIGGPTGAFVVIVYGVIAKHGYDGLIIAATLAGLMLIAAGLLRAGDLIKYFPDPVTTGFTTGIAIIIFTSQIKDFFGLSIPHAPADFLPKLAALWEARGTLNLQAVWVASLSLAIILGCRRYAPQVPGFLLATVVGALATAFLKLPIPTIGSVFGAMPSSLPPPSFGHWDLAKVKEVAPSAFTIALLAGVESLLSAVVADQLTGRRHRSNVELVAQGIANIASAAFGGLPATGAIARTATNIRSGARSPVAGMLHAVFILAFMLLFARFASYIPLATLAAILMVVALNMAEIDRFKTLVTSSRGERAVLLATCGLTVLVDLTMAIEAGMVLAAFIFMHRMAGLASIEHEGALVEGDQDDFKRDGEAYAPNFALPKDVGVINFRGPLFFGSASLLKDALDQIGAKKRVFVLNFEESPMIDATGAHALGKLIARLEHGGTRVILAGARPMVMRELKRSTPAEVLDKLERCDDMAAARSALN